MSQEGRSDRGPLEFTCFKKLLKIYRESLKLSQF